MFEGCSILVPSLYTQTCRYCQCWDQIISHACLSWGFLPVRIAFPTMAPVMLGPSTNIPSRSLLGAFRDYLGHGSLLSERHLKLKAIFLVKGLVRKQLSILSGFGCRLVPSPRTLPHVLHLQSMYNALGTSTWRKQRCHCVHSDG